MNNCILCKLAKKEAPVSVIYEDDFVIAFMDIKPVNIGHCLVIPKEHLVYIADMDEETGAHLFKITMRVAEAVRRSGVKCDGINLFLADGESAGQEVFHLHMHIIPRFKDDKFIVDADWSLKPTRDELNEVAEDIESQVL